MLILALGAIATVLLGERWLAQRRAGRTRRGTDRALGLGLGLLGVGTAWTGLLLLAGDGVVPATPDALRSAGRPSVETPGSAAAPVPVREAATSVPGWAGRALAWPAPLPGSTPFGLADLAVLGGAAVAVGALVVERRRASAGPTRIEQGAVALLGTPAAPAVAQVAGWELRCPAGVFVVDAQADGAIVVVGVGEATASDGIHPPVLIPEGHGTTLAPFGTVGPVEPIPAAELDRDPLLWSHGRRDRVQRAIDGGSASRTTRTRRATVAAAVAALVVLALLGINASLAQLVSVPSASMAPTLQPGDRLVVDKAAGPPRRGDVVVFERAPNDQTSTELLLVKRVVAVGGQLVSILDGRVLVDGVVAGGGPTEAVCDDTEWLVPAGAVFVLGDARADSFDSRCFGPISTELVVGRVRGRVWPLGDAGRLPPLGPR